jgi:hypothetical protein
MNTPHPDPGEEYPHINTDFFGIQDPKNRFMPLARMVAPYNAPDYPRQQPTMDGFVAHCDRDPRRRRCGLGRVESAKRSTIVLASCVYAVNQVAAILAMDIVRL